ncbi:DUF1810 family protein [Niveispirillum sp. SYP-B3756]|uniref:DUF1810 domain-containing protein n=1 Tax=Niveispirillum sp. SYP-B3756 TaxID=2662178 RepID=UPI00129224B9|nr:DUF1810 domain-containing protein [Niveispirillum sp. SYP-B3756]MQP63809.1 DUF1810 family protein [Niveispirillum sp. SYP-B3756]
MSGFDAQRFLDAQEPMIDQALAEIRAGSKQSHWMWFIFPQLRGLGRSPTAQFFGLADLAEAQTYLRHPILGSRLYACTTAVMGAPVDSLHQLFGTPDDLKFRSCMTLFERAGGDGTPLFKQALDRWCGGERDSSTLALL